MTDIKDGFSTAWLRLREDADRRARNRTLTETLSARMVGRTAVSVVDLGCGTGANLRATFPLLTMQQSWTLVDHDQRLLDAARRELSDWADRAESTDDGLNLEKDSRQITVRFRALDLAKHLDDAIESGTNLVTASAFFDLVSVAGINRLAALVASRRATFYSVLNYNGQQRWSPRRPSDNAVISAFHEHQMRDKGFGPAAGPGAPIELADQFMLNEYGVQEGQSPWKLGPSDRDLIDALKDGHVKAVSETGRVDQKSLDAWRAIARAEVDIGHTDILAFPA